MKSNRILSACLAVVILSASTIGTGVSAAKSAGNVKVGFYYGGSPAYSMHCYSANGFELGQVVGNNFVKKDSSGVSDVIVKPDGMKSKIKVTDKSSGKEIYTHDNTNSFALRAKSGSTVTIQENGGKRYPYYGFFEFSANGGGMTIINHVESELYTKGVMGNEIGNSATPEVTKAFAVLARTVPLKHKHANQGFDVCSHQCCQIYRGTNNRNEFLDSMVNQTKGQILTYDGEPIISLYHYSNGGASCSSAAMWGTNDIPYLKSVKTNETKSSVWQKTFTKTELLKYLQNRPAFSSLRGGIKSVEITETDPLGSEYVTGFEVTDIYGNTVTVTTSYQIRTSLGMSTANFKLLYAFKADIAEVDGVENKQFSSVITANGVTELHGRDTIKYLTADGYCAEKEMKANVIIFDGKGQGHGVGFSQLGAESLVSEGHDYMYTLKYFFPGTEITALK